MQVVDHFEDFAEYQNDEGARRRWLSEFRPIADRALTHFQKQSWELFDREVAKIDPDLPTGSLAERFDTACRISRGTLALFTFDHSKFRHKIEQRLALASSISEELTVDSLYLRFLESGRLMEWW